MIKTLIIDDEKLARALVRKFAEGHREIEVVGEASNGFEGLKMIQDLQPQLLFLDVQMPKLNGFELLELLENPPQVIFTTAYDEYAIKAFEQNAVDYLLKPFSKERFAQALEKLGKVSQEKSTKEKKSIPHRESADRIVIKDGTEISILAVKDVTYIQAQDDYVEINVEGKKYLKNQTMKYYESVLPQSTFVRIHRSFILNITCLSRLEKYGKETYLAIMHNGDKLNVSAGGYQKLKVLLGV